MKYKITIFLFLILLAVGLYFVSDMVKIMSIEITGNVHNTEDEILEIVGFTKEATVLDTIKHRPKKIENKGYIARIDISYPSITSIKIEVIEKERMGYLKYMSSYLCIDSNAYIIDSVKTPDSDVARIEGINIKSFALDEALEIDDDMKLALLNIYKLLKTYDLTADVINLNFKKTDHITLEMGKVNVQLGNGSRLEEKIGLMRDIMATMEEGKEGILYLENPDKKIIFKNTKAEPTEGSLESEDTKPEEKKQ